MSRKQMMKLGSALLAATLALLLQACSTVPPAGERTLTASQRAVAAGLMPQRMTAGLLPLQGFVRSDCAAGEPLAVYIEGDGHAWVSVELPSTDPTPVNPVALQLAIADPACSVAYLGRPGQYLQEKGDARYWLEARFAPEVIDSYVAVIARLAQERKSSVIHVTGYSGGGAVAALVAARLAQGPTGITLRTVAGNLDTATWAKRRRLTPLATSLNPADVAAALADVPQLHLAGTRDRQVPLYVLDAFLARLPAQHCVRKLYVEAGHGGPWEDAWRRHAGETPACMPPAFQEANPPSPAEKR
jgi:pimeloyl-ACP methyl ester carboxylesterase